ncbi:MAG: hypothetical protein AAB571_01005 [Chloroflexota bacterium]
MDTQPRYTELLKLLANANVNMVVVGGVAMVLRASDAYTYDVDICFERTPQNAERLCRALAPYCQPIRSAFFDVVNLLTTITKGEKFKTDLGDIDLIGEISGLGDYHQLLEYSEPIEVENFVVQVLTLDGLIKAKEAANRPKDQLHLITLRALKKMEDEE